MPARIVWDVSVIPAPALIANAFFQSAERTSQMEGPVRRVTERFSQEIEENFAAEGRPTHWQELAEYTIARREREGYSAGPILTRSGDLRDSATSPDAWDIASSGQLVVAQLAAEGYGRFHISGWTYGPVRDWSYISPEADEAVDEIFGAWLDNAFEPVEALP